MRLRGFVDRQKAYLQGGISKGAEYICVYVNMKLGTYTLVCPLSAACAVSLSALISSCRAAASNFLSAESHHCLSTPAARGGNQRRLEYRSYVVALARDRKELGSEGQDAAQTGRAGSAEACPSS